MNEQQAAAAMKDGRISNYVVNPETGKVDVKADMSAEQPTASWPSAKK
jgi:hypothetical protein